MSFVRESFVVRFVLNLKLGTATSHIEFIRAVNVSGFPLGAQSSLTPSLSAPDQQGLEQSATVRNPQLSRVRPIDRITNYLLTYREGSFPGLALTGVHASLL